MRAVLVGCAISLACLGVARDAGAQTPLARGDVAFTGYDSGGADELSFVLLQSVVAGTTISFTERGWLAAGGFRAGEATFTLTFGADYPCGSELRVVMAPLAVLDQSGASAGAVAGGGHSLSTSGDQVFAFQGAEPSAESESSFLAAIQMNGPWDADATSANASARPASLAEGVAAIAIAPEVDNARYDCSLASGSAGELGSAINDASRWLRSDATPFDLTTSCSFACAGGPTPTQVPTPTLTPPILTPTPTASPTPVPTATPTANPTPTSIPTALATATPAPTATPSPTATPVPTATPTPTVAPTGTASPAPATPTPTSEPIVTPSPLPSATPSATPLPTAPTPTVAVVQPQSKGQQRCILALNRGLLKVARAQAGEIARCARAFAKGKEPSSEACVAADAKGIVQRARAALVRDAAGGCDEAPDFGPTDAGVVGTAASSAARGLFTDLLGDLDGGLALAAERERSRCQQTIVAATRRCHEAHLAEFNRCKQKGLKSGAIASAVALAACVGADAKGRVAQTCDLGHDGNAPVDPLRRALRDVCAGKGVPPSDALPACSGASDVEAGHACILARITCRVCTALSAADGVTVDCDALDDGVANASCAP